MKILKRKMRQAMRRLGCASAQNVEDASAIAKGAIAERDAAIESREKAELLLASSREDCNTAVRERDMARCDARYAREHAAAVTRAMGKVRTAMAQVFDSVKEMEHWLAKHGEEIIADLDADLAIGGGVDLGDHHSSSAELNKPQARYIGTD